MEIGEHCTLKSCASLTFLPIVCPYCRSPFCQSHFLPLQHACQAPGAAEADRTLSDSEILKRIQRANTRRKQVQGSTHDAQSSSSSGSLDVSEPPNRLPCQLKGCKRFSLQMDNPQQDIHASANIKPNTTLQDGSHGRRTFTHVAPRCDRCHGFFCMPHRSPVAHQCTATPPKTEGDRKRDAAEARKRRAQDVLNKHFPNRRDSRQ